MVASSTIYGGTYNLFAVTMKKMGVEFTFVSPHATEEELDAAFQPNTKAVFGEPSPIRHCRSWISRNLQMRLTDMVYRLSWTIPLPRPVHCRPIEFGADIVTHSTTKYMDGHGAGVGGCIVDSGKFDWTEYPDKFPGLCEPDDSYHGITYAEKFGLAGAYITKATAQLMRDFGSIQSPQNAFLLNLGLESLHVRIKRHAENGLAVAKFLQGHDKVAWVKYCGLEGDDDYELAQKYLPDGSCGVVSFGVKGGRAAAEDFMQKLKVAAIETHVADARTCCLHPASATHRQMNDEELAAAGVSPDLVRYSCGLEDAEDLIADLKQALE